MKSNPLRQKLIDELTLRNYSENTITAYVQAVRRIAARFRQSPDQVTVEQLRELLLEMAYSKAAASTLNVTVCAWIFFYGKILDQDVTKLKEHLPKAKEPKLQIRAYSREDVRTLLYESNLNLKHQTVLSTVYHAGLRVSEACQLQIDDIQTSNGLILVRQGKGRKDRYTSLPERLLNELRGYYQQYRPKKPWVFTSQTYPSRPYASATVRRIFYNALTNARLPNRGGIHCLRHSFAVHRFQDGMDIVRLQKVLGHASIVTTAHYLQSLAETPKLADSPLDAPTA